MDGIAPILLPFVRTIGNFFLAKSRMDKWYCRKLGKSAVTKRARTINPAFAWQRYYYEHIIRDDKSYIRISEYIKNNPQNWRKDDYHDL